MGHHTSKLYSLLVHPVTANVKELFLDLLGGVLMFYYPFFPSTASCMTLARFKFVFFHFCPRINFSDDVM